MLRSKAKLGSYFSVLPLAGRCPFPHCGLGIRNTLKSPSLPLSLPFLIVLPQRDAVVTHLDSLGCQEGIFMHTLVPSDDGRAGE